MLGAANSPAVYKVMAEENLPQECEWCGRRVIPDWQHIAWDCEFTAHTRPRTPTDPLQLRLGWATHTDTEDSARRVLLHLAKVRALALHSW